MKYTDAKKSEWLKTTRNYLISKAVEMKHYLPWAESFQSSVITHDHVRALATVQRQRTITFIVRALGTHELVLARRREDRVQKCGSRQWL